MPSVGVGQRSKLLAKHIICKQVMERLAIRDGQRPLATFVCSWEGQRRTRPRLSTAIIFCMLKHQTSSPKLLTTAEAYTRLRLENYAYVVVYGFPKGWLI